MAFVPPDISEPACGNTFFLGGLKREAMRRQRVQMDGQILLGVLDLTRGRRRDSGAGSIHPAVALLFDQIAGTVQHAAHGQAVLVSYGNVGHMGNFPPPGAQSSKFAAAEEAGGDAPLKPANASVVGSRTKACGSARAFPKMM